MPYAGLTVPKGYTELGWHFLPDDRRTRFSREPVRRGTVLTESRPLRLCLVGLHYSTRAIDALQHAHGPVVCIVAAGGEILRCVDKCCAARRKCLAIADATETLHRFAVWCARQALHAERKAGREPDPRSWEALRVKLRWLGGRAADEELAAAVWAAELAGWAAAEVAAWAAAWAAWAASRSAAWESARSAARWAALASTGAEEKQGQNAALERMLSRLLTARAK